MSTDKVVIEVLPSQGLSREAYSIVCEGSEATLADCFVKQERVTTCHYVLVHCANSQAGGLSAGAVAGIVVAVLVVVVLVIVAVVVVAVLGVIWWKAHLKSHDNR